MLKAAALSTFAAVLIAMSAGAAAGSPASPPQTPEESGRRFAEAHCSSCHAVGLRGGSPNPEAPRFRDIASMYPPEELARALNEGIAVDHSRMPAIVLSPDRADELAAYLKTLAR